MNDIIIQAYSDRKLSKKSVDIGNMQENKVTKLIFELDEGITALGGNVYLFVSYDGDTHPYPLKDNSIEIGRELTQRKKTEVNLVVSTSDDPEDILKDTVWISNTLMLFTDKNGINIDSINEQELPPSLKIVYDELFALQSDLQKKLDEDYWRGKDGKDGATFTPTVSDDGILSWTNDKGLQNPKSANIKGPAGKTAYQHAVDGGYKGTEEEFRESLVNLMEFEAYKANSILSKSTGEVVATTDSAKAKPKNIRLYGKTEQDSTEGNQLLDAKKIVGNTINGITINNTDGDITLNGTATANVDFYITVNEKYTELRDLLNTKKGTYTLSNNIGAENWYRMTESGYEINTFTITETDTLKRLYLRIPRGATFSNKTLEIMLNAGDTALPWEPYTGGEASPNMNYQQPLNSHGDSGSIVGSIFGKNKAPIELLKDGFINASGKFEIVKNESYPNAKNLPLIPISDGDYVYYKFGIDANLVRFRIVSNDGNVISILTVDSSIGVVRVTTGGYICALFLDDSITDSIMQINEPIDSKSDYQQFTALTPNGLPGIPLGQTIPDAIKNSPIHMAGVYWDKAEEQYYISDTIENGQKVQRIDKSIVDLTDKTLAVIPTLETDGVNIRYFQLPFKSIHKNTDSVQPMSNKFTRGTSLYPSISLADIGLLFRNQKKDGTYAFTDVETFRNAVGEFEIEYVLEMPIVTDTSEEELDQYNALLMNYPNTTVVNDAGVYMEVEYVCDTQKHIEQNYIPKSEHEALKSRVSDIENVIAKL